ncbi:WASH complex subunit 1 [Ixodes scapularis]|uniref:WASH complex subunit 1 n=1 Tax=Ixodes scapularis TaxID=6945 RepID=UPI001A9FBDDD|nr:WASH complex subunit 1 [Ixodes scapularis]
MKFQPYEAVLIPPDLRHDECIVQVADCLDHLDRVTAAVMDGILARVAEYRSRLQDIQARADLARAKISIIRGSSKATKVFSSYKYPSKEPEASNGAPRPSAVEVPLLRSHARVKSQHTAPDDRLLKEKLQFFNVRPPSKPTPDARGEEGGLGRLPDCTDSVGSLLLFNTGESPYTKYVMRDPLGAVARTSAATKGAGDTQGNLMAAPASMSGASQRDVPHEAFLYTPGRGQAPQMNVPAALPDLPGVADDLSYSEELGPSIAPSWLPELPEIPEGNSLPAEAPTDCPLPPESSTDCCPPPQTASPELPTACDAAPPAYETTVADLSEPSADGGRTEEAVSEPCRDVVPEDGSARASLLESIRKAGGKAALRSARREQHKKQAAAPAGDLMSDLRSKLQLRRKGISGDQDGSRRAAPVPQVTSPLDRVLEIIPVHQRDSEDNTSTTDTEWNDSD